MATCNTRRCSVIHRVTKSTLPAPLRTSRRKSAKRPGKVSLHDTAGCLAGGIGSRLLERALQLAEADRRIVRLESTLNAVGFYEKFRFRQVEHSVARRNRVAVPIVVMQRQAD